jgi:hypothetical protein
MKKVAWFIQLENQTVGPLLTDSLIMLLKTKRVSMEDLAWHDGLPRWVKLADCPEIKDQLTTEAKAGSAPPTPGTAPVPSPTPSAVMKVETVELEARHPARPSSPATPSPAASPKPTPTPNLGFRRSERAPLRGKIVLPDGRSFEVVNISETGLLLKSPELLAPGTALEFRLESEDLGIPSPIRAMVTRHVIIPGFRGFGVEFTDMEDHLRMVIRGYIKAKVFT